MKQPGITVYFNKKDKSKTSETGNCEMKRKKISVDLLQVYSKLQKEHNLS